MMKKHKPDLLMNWLEETQPTLWPAIPLTQMLRAEREEAGARLARLKSYAQHSYTCERASVTNPKVGCVCGLTELLEELP